MDFLQASGPPRTQESVVPVALLKAGKLVRQPGKVDVFSQEAHRPQVWDLSCTCKGFRAVSQLYSSICTHNQLL